MKILKILSLSILSIIVIFITFSSLFQLAHMEIIGFVFRTEGFSGYALKIPSKEIDAVFDQAKTSMENRAAGFKSWETVSVLASWCAFILSGIITVVAGFNGQVRQDNDVTGKLLLESLENKSKTVRLITIIAAFATLSTGVSVKAKQYATDKKEQAVELRDLITSSYKDIQDAASENEARAVLEKLRLASEL